MAGLQAAGAEIIDTGAPQVPTTVVAKNVRLRTSKGREGMAVIAASHATASVSGSTLQSVSCQKMAVLIKATVIADVNDDANGR